MNGREIEFLINKLTTASSKNMKVSIPALVVNVQNIKKGLISVLPIVNFRDNHTHEYYEYGALEDIRVVFPSNTTSTICFPVKVGDTVDVVFKSCSISSFLNGNKNPHNPSQTFVQNMLDCCAYVGFQTTQESCFDANNYANEFDNTSLNIVHNKNTPQESKIEIKESGDVVVSSNSNIEMKSSVVDIESETVNTNNAVINVDNDIVIQGVSLIQFIRSHTHNYSDDGRPMVTAPPNSI